MKVLVHNDSELFDLLVPLRYGNVEKVDGVWMDGTRSMDEVEEKHGSFSGWKKRVQEDIDKLKREGLKYPCVVCSWINWDFSDGVLVGGCVFPEDFK